jgi:ankyrin repeat protein
MYPLQQALHAAAKNGSAPVVEYLINEGFSVDSSACYLL